ncbi:MAG: magnesium/cobalt transporter CorA [Betaproteobacteria bacterium]|nr:magnesium/cobalt transporter CorA [Betaproteobacteria bacterium]
MARMLKGRSARLGMPPGSLVYVGERSPRRPRITVMDYDASRFDETVLAEPRECAGRRDTAAVTWINVDALAYPGTVEEIGTALGFHPLMQEDILNSDQRTKTEDHGEHVFVALKMLSWPDARETFEIEQLSLVLGQRYVISFQERAGDFFDPLRDRIRQNAGRIRRLGPDYLAYCLLDVTIDHYFIVLERLGERIEAVEDAVMTRPRVETLHDIHALKRQLLLMRKSVWPAREMIGSLRNRHTPLVSPAVQPFLRDLQDHVEQVIEGVATYQALLTDTLATYLSSQSNRTNTIMKVLAVFSAVFMPLTFVTGVFGMNFRRVPLIDWEWGFVATVGSMALLGALLAAFFIQKRWL